MILSLELLIPIGMFRMSSASWGRKCCLIKSRSQFTLLPLTLSFTMIEVRLPGLLIQGSLSIWIMFPFPTLHLWPLEKRSLPQQILLQAAEGEFPIRASMKFPSLKYLPRRILKRRLLGCLSSLQLCFASIAWLKAFICLNPKPPWSLLQHIRSQLIQSNASFFYLLLFPTITWRITCQCHHKYN